MLVAADMRQGAVVLSGGGEMPAFETPCLCAAASGGTLACFAEREAVIFAHGVRRFFTPPPQVTRAFFARRALAALSQDGGAVCLLDAETGVLCLGVPLGGCPNDMALSPCGRYLAVSVGNEARVLDASTLRALARMPVGGEAVCACFQGGALYALIRRGEAGALVRAGRGALKRLPSAPLSLCAFGRGLMIGVSGQVLHTDQTGRILRAWSSALPVRLVAARDGAYAADPFEQRVTHYPLTGRARVIARLPAPVDLAL